MRRASRTSEVPGKYDPFSDDEEKEQWRESQQTVYNSPNVFQRESRKKSTGRTLFNKRPVLIFPDIAAALGGPWHSAIVQQVHYWVTEYEESGRATNRKRGHYWHYCTVEQWCRYLPFVKRRTIESVLSDLKSCGVLVGEKLGDHVMDNTTWYRVDYGILEAMLNTEDSGE